LVHNYAGCIATRNPDPWHRHIGHKKHDEETQTETQVDASGTQPTTESSSNTAPLYTTPAAEKKEPGVLRQIL
jgi:hypothetical protein